MTECHGEFNHFNKLLYQDYDPDETAVIILGDAGLNFFLDYRDTRAKRYLNSFGFTIYCVRGNHEFRPTQLPAGMVELVYDNDVKNWVYQETNFPKIKYFLDGSIYNIGGKRTLVIGGAYSIDKDYRRANNLIWNPQEMLNKNEQKDILENILGLEVDIVLTHTCPESWEPTDLFLKNIDQSKVNKSMERFLEKVSNAIDWKIWFWGHYHATRFYPEDENHHQRFMVYHDFLRVV